MNEKDNKQQDKFDFKQSQLKLVIIILLLQSFLLIVIITIHESKLQQAFFSNSTRFVIAFIVIASSCLSIILVLRLYRMIISQAELKIKMVKLEEERKTVQQLKRQHHDFVNNLQTIYSLAQLDKKEELLNYIEDVTEDVQKVEVDNVHSQIQIIEATLLPMKKKALEANIDFSYELQQGFKQINASTNQIMRVLLNLIDNAIDATKEFNGDKKIQILGNNYKDEYIISVHNSGPIIEREKIKEILKEGISSKGENRGLGLYIVQDILDKVNGRLEIKSEEGVGTKFICHFVKENK